MAADAILDVANALLGMFGADLVRLMLVTAKAGVAFEVAALVASGAGCIMLAG